ncbi:MAG: O-antigen ligase family protein [Eubacteriales bacterium]
MAKNRKRRKSKRKYQPLEWFYFIPLLVIVGIVPLIVFGKVLTIEGEELLHWKGAETNIDFFSYYKSVIFSVMAYISFIVLVLLRLTNQFKFKITKYYIPLLLYGFGVVVSFMISDYPVVARRGFIEQFQGVWVMIGYALVIASVYNYVEEEKQVKLLTYGFIFSAVFIGIIGMGQYLGADLYKTTFGKELILPGRLEHLAPDLNFTFAKNTIYATLYNTNFVGSFSALLLPFALSLFLYATELKYKVLAGLFSALMVLTWIGSNSRAGYLGFSVGFIFMLVLYRKKIVHHIKAVGIIAVVFVVVIFGLNSVSDGRVARQFSRLNIFNEFERLENIQENSLRWEDIKLDENSITIDTNRQDLKAELEGNEFKFYDGDNQPLEIDIADGKNVTFKDERYKNFKAELNHNNRIINITAYGKNFMTFFGGEEFKIAGIGNVLRTTDYPPRLEFMDGYEKFASSRGYIWSRSVPILKETLIAGYGPDTYPIAFPQYDYVGKLNSFTSHRTIVDKPHNMYLQIGINNGVLSLVSLLAIFIMYTVDSFRVYFKRDINSFMEYIGVGAFTGVMGYLAAGMFNDQIISVAPLFYVMLGLGLAVNRILAKKDKDPSKAS